MVMKKHQKEVVMMIAEKPTGSGESGGTRYKGVRKRKWGKYVSEIRLPNCRERIWLGSFDSAEKAARAFDAAMFCLRGPNASFNFPHNPPTNIPGAHSLSREQIQQAAAKFANDPPPTTSPSTSTSVSVISDLDAMLATMGSASNYATDFGFFSGFDDMSGEYYSPALTSPDIDYGQEEVLGQDSFLWNF